MTKLYRPAFFSVWADAGAAASAASSTAVPRRSATRSNRVDRAGRFASRRMVASLFADMTGWSISDNVLSHTSQEELVTPSARTVRPALVDGGERTIGP